MRARPHRLRRNGGGRHGLHRPEDARAEARRAHGAAGLPGRPHPPRQRRRRARPVQPERPRHSRSRCSPRSSECAKTMGDKPWLLGGGWLLPTFPGGNPTKELPRRDRARQAGDARARPTATPPGSTRRRWSWQGSRSDTPDPKDGRIERDPVTKAATGHAARERRPISSASTCPSTPPPSASTACAAPWRCWPRAASRPSRRRARARAPRAAARAARCRPTSRPRSAAS